MLKEILNSKTSHNGYVNGTEVSIQLVGKLYVMTGGIYGPHSISSDVTCNVLESEWLCYQSMTHNEGVNNEN